MFSIKYKNACAGVLIKKSFSAATTLYLGLSRSPINADGSGIDEPDDSTGYQRFAITVNSANWNDPVDGIFTNKNEIMMSDIKTDAGIASYWFLSESPTGSAEIWDKFESIRHLDKDSTIIIAPNELKIGVVNPTSTN